MPVYTVMAENPPSEPYRLHNEAVKDAQQALATVERFRERQLANIRIYRETSEISIAELSADATAHKS